METDAKPNFIGFPEQKLKQLFAEWEVAPYRVHQIFNWVYNQGARNFSTMSNLSKVLRGRLDDYFDIALPKAVGRTQSRDGSIKFLFELKDGMRVESVWMPDEGRKSLCISTQVGCRLGCTFCLTGTLGLKRQLTVEEIIGQVMSVNDELPEEDRVTNLVIMGMGEPLDNYGPVCDALRLLISPEAMRFSTRKITLSTSGLVDKIEQFKQEKLPVNLAISLNATEDATRDRIMPINKKYPIKVLLDSLRDYPLKPTRRITFEYVMLKGVNDSMDDARRLGRLLHGIPSKINLIVFNAFEGTEFDPPDAARVKEFQNYLIQKKYSVFIRKNRGTDILGACGQLAAQTLTSSVTS